METKKQINEQNRNMLIVTELRLRVARKEQDSGMGNESEEVKKYKLVVTKQSWGYEV